jgi:hypothetical protein
MYPGLWVERNLGAHDDDPRVPVLANRHGPERPRYVTGFQSRRLTVFSSIIATALIVLPMSAPGQRHLTRAVRSSNRLSPVPPSPAEGVRAARHANTPGDRAEPQSWPLIHADRNSRI